MINSLKRHESFGKNLNSVQKNWSEEWFRKSQKVATTDANAAWSDCYEILCNWNFRTGYYHSFLWFCSVCYISSLADCKANIHTKIQHQHCSLDMFRHELNTVKVKKRLNRWFSHFKHWLDRSISYIQFFEQKLNSFWRFVSLQRIICYFRFFLPRGEV